MTHHDDQPDDASLLAPPDAVVVKPDQLVRLEGETQLQPDAATAEAMVASGRTRVVSSWKVCIDATGAVDEVQVIRSTGFVAYDVVLAAGIRTWRFKPYLVDGAPVRACTAQTFVWTAA